ncbi:hypothetical protein ABLI39_06090 [Pseudarthrobacter sp. B907]|uniref:hypothetical protein n=1 Tax=Pseudarthrobacter sp. B907 TaxID=3158261 RepID=UPI0032DA6D26
MVGGVVIRPCDHRPGRELQFRVLDPRGSLAGQVVLEEPAGQDRGPEQLAVLDLEAAFHRPAHLAQQPLGRGRFPVHQPQQALAQLQAAGGGNQVPQGVAVDGVPEPQFGLGALGDAEEFLFDQPGDGGFVHHGLDQGLGHGLGQRHEVQCLAFFGRAPQQLAADDVGEPFAVAVQRAGEQPHPVALQQRPVADRVVHQAAQQQRVAAGGLPEHLGDIGQDLGAEPVRQDFGRLFPGERAQVVPFGDALEPELQERLGHTRAGRRADQQLGPAGGGEFHQHSRRCLIEVVGVVDDQQQRLLRCPPLPFQVAPEGPKHGQLGGGVLHGQAHDERCEHTVRYVAQRRAPVQTDRRHLAAKLLGHGLHQLRFADPVVTEQQHGDVCAALKCLHRR